MNPQSIFWTTLIVMAVLVYNLSRRYRMLRVDGTLDSRPFSWSRVQLAWWTVIILSSFITILFVYNETPVLSTSTVILLGISAATTAVARTIDVSDATSPDTVADTRPNRSRGLFLDILSDQNGVNIHRFQTVVFNFVFGCWFVVSVLENLHNLPDDGVGAIMPDFATTNLVLLGLSSATYAALKTNEKKPTAPQNNQPAPDPADDQAGDPW